MYRECLFARYRLLIATGLSETASRLGVGLSVGSVHIVFQHPVYLLTPFVVDSAVVAFDARAIYIEHRIARLRDEGDKNVCVCGLDLDAFTLGMWKQLTASNLEDGIATSI